MSDETAPAAATPTHYPCPDCGRRGTLWENITVVTWRAIDDHLKPPETTRSMRDVGDDDIDWKAAEPTGEVGCAECGWEGLKSELEPVDDDGSPASLLHPSQLTIESGGPERTDLEVFREKYLPKPHAKLDDESLQAVIDGAKEWVGGRRYSWTVVAANYLRDGRYHG